jgi:hypothetical protein
METKRPNTEKTMLAVVGSSGPVAVRSFGISLEVGQPANFASRR